MIDFTPDMQDVWSVADLAVCRSGAGTCAELASMNVPSILMPYPFHKDMHQAANAQVLVDAGAAEVVDDQKDASANASALLPLLEKLLYEASRRKVMSEAAETVARRDAAELVARDVLKMAGNAA